MTSILPFKIFVVEDNEWYGELLVHRLGQHPNHNVRRFTTARTCLDHLDEQPDFITLDYSLPDAKGEQLLRQIRERMAGVEVVVISGQEDVGTAVSMLRHGAYDYLVKDENTLDRLWNIVDKVEQQVRLRHENTQLRQQIGTQYSTGHSILGDHVSIRQVHTLIAKAARTIFPVSMSGETGTGKEEVAKAIHFQSSLASQPFVAVNIAAIPPELVESELFGHEKNALPGAAVQRMGRIEEANGGTLFLNEITDLELGVQAKLLRVLQEQEVVRVGGNQPVAFVVRPIVGTHRDLFAEVEAGRFLEDLYYHLLGLPIVLPPLRQRGSDVLLLADIFVRDFCRLNNLRPLYLNECARTRLMSYSFPGNVRELKAVMELAAVLVEGEEIRAEDLPLRHSPASAVPNSHSNSHLSLRDQTTVIVQNCLDEMGGDVLAAAARLGIGKSTIYRMIQQQELHLE